MAGEYRKENVLNELPEEIAKPIRDGAIRIALTHTPVEGAVKRPDLNEQFAQAYENSSEPKYARGLRNGSMVVIVITGTLSPEHGGDPNATEKTWAPGELFFTS